VRSLAMTSALLQKGRCPKDRGVYLNKIILRKEMIKIENNIER
jgi:hypothetical protein